MKFLPTLLNKKTTLSGYGLILAAIISSLSKLFIGQLPEISDATLLITGLGLIMAKDGGH